MKKLWKNWNEHRPIVLYRFWFTLMIINLSIAAFLAWAGSAYPQIETTTHTWVSFGLAGISYGFTQLWRYYINNPEKYEELQKRRPGRTRRTTSDKDKKK